VVDRVYLDVDEVECMGAIFWGTCSLVLIPLNNKYIYDIAKEKEELLYLIPITYTHFSPCIRNG
jgi:hypothetical protein